MSTEIGYTERPPSPELASCVQSLWEMRAPARLATTISSRLVPDGCIDLVVYIGDGSANAPRGRSYLKGTMLRSLVVPLAGHVHIVGACLRPGTVLPFAGVAAPLLADRVVMLDDAWGSAATTLEDEIGDGAADGALDRLSAALVRQRRDRWAIDAVVGEAVRRIRSSAGSLGIGELAGELGLSARQLERRFGANVGLGPKLFSRLTRFDCAARKLRAKKRGTSWSAIAGELGYHDQAHFIHEFRGFAGVTPGEFELEQRGVAILQ